MTAFSLPTSATSKSAIVQVAAAAIRNAEGDVLLAKRPAHKHKGDLWEFPGGKLESGETAEQALVREIKEELGIDVVRPHPLLRVIHHYPEKSVCLMVFNVTEFSGIPSSLEDQPLQWVALDKLNQFSMPEADKPIVDALQLPSMIAITPSLYDWRKWQVRLQQISNNDACWLQWRDHALSDVQYRCSVQELLSEFPMLKNRLILNRHPEVIHDLPCAGWHYSSSVLNDLQRLSFQSYLTKPWQFAAVHNEEELALACALDVQACVLSPVLATSSHPSASTMGWSLFSTLNERARRPCYALGGVGRNDVAMSKYHGGFGIAGIRDFFDADKL